MAISPLRVNFDGDARLSIVRLTNTGAEKVSMQVNPVGWSQDPAGRDHYEATRDVVAFPPIFSLLPGETQVVRVGAQNPPSQDIEQAYRLFFTEIPPPRDESNPAALRMRLRISIPVFDTPNSELAPQMEIQRTWFEGDLLKVRLKNTGNTHLRAQTIEVTDSSGISSAHLGRYYLPGSTHDVEVSLTDGASVSAIKITTDLLGDSLFDAEDLTGSPANLVAGGGSKHDGEKPPLSGSRD